MRRSQNISADTATMQPKQGSRPMGRKQGYNSRPYVPRTINSKIANLPHLRNALKRKCYTLPGMWDGAYLKSCYKIEKSRKRDDSQPHARAHIEPACGAWRAGIDLTDWCIVCLF